MAKSSSKKKTEGDVEKAPSFEKALERLEEIVGFLDDGNMPLEESLALFKEGTKLAKLCRSLLAEAEVQVKEALRDVESAGAGDGEADESDESEDEDESI
jgi:exodeoxyribonuclease VII small subunit